MEQDTFQADYCAERLRALGDPLRLRIVDLLRCGEMTVSDISQLLDAELVTVSHHLQVLKHSQLVTPRREGRFMYYRLPKELLRAKGKASQYLDLGCCKIEVPRASGTMPSGEAGPTK